MSGLCPNLQLVCHQIRSADNLGAIARVMANFGGGKIVLSDPRTYGVRDAEKLGVRATSYLETMGVAGSLEEALGGVVYAVGTTSREAVRKRVVLAPEEGVRRLQQAALRGPVAIVLGGEKRGLSDEELSLCQDVVVIPTEPAQPSMNVAQAAGVLLYLCSRVEATPDSGGPPTARLEVVQAIERRLREALTLAGYLQAQSPVELLRELTRPLARAGLTAREAELWAGATDKLTKALGRAQPR